MLIGGLVVWCTCIALMLALSTPLKGDEAAYALLARGVDQTWIYRPIGFVTFARIGTSLGDSELALRLPSALLAPGLLIAIYVLGQRLGPWVGAGAAAVIAGTHTFVLRAPALLNDIPSTTCLLAAIALVISELDRDRGASYRLVLAAPVMALTFYLRYGSAPTLAILCLAACAIWWRTIRRRPGPVIATAAVLALLIAPFLIHSVQTTGSIVGILLLASEASGRVPTGEGLHIYLVANPFTHYGVLITPVLVVGVLAIVCPPAHARRRAGFLAIIAVGQIVTLGLVSHANVRFIFVAVALLTILGVDALLRAFPQRFAARIAAVAIVAGWAGMVIRVVPIERRIGRGLTDLVAAGAAIRADAGGRPCTVVARATPQIMWYSGCGAVKVRTFDGVSTLPADRRWYTANTPRRPADPEALAASIDAEAIPLVDGAWYLRPRTR